MGAKHQFGFRMIKSLWSSGRRFLCLPLQKGYQPFVSAISAVKEPTKHLKTLATPVIQSDWKHCKPITVISANLWHDWPRHRRLQARLDAFASLAESESADIVLLQEVTRTKELKVDEWLADRLKMGYAYARVNGHASTIGFEEGLAVFSRYPLETPRWQQLGESACQMSRRMVLGAQVNTPCGNLVVFSVHLGISTKHNRLQVDRLRNWIGTTVKDQTALIGGDFNAHENRSQIRSLQSNWVDIFREVNPDGDGTTHELHWPWGKPIRRRRLDYLFMQNGGAQWQVLDADHIGVMVDKGSHSDHRAVLARLITE
jgi:endonuclease/exonuclease/phosphatase family metal-dependent hydrolase